MLTSASDSPHQRSRIWLFLLWLAAFYSTWVGLILSQGWGQLVLNNWPMSLAMLFGSYVAGSTPMGGGTIGFPVLVLLFDQPATMGRDFSFCVQSIGMTSASIYILSTRQPLATRVLLGAIAGSAIGTPLGVLFLAPLVSETVIKVVFAVVWASFGLLTFWRLRDLIANKELGHRCFGLEVALGVIVGLTGGLFVASITGVGVDMLVYTVLVLLLGVDLKVAIPTSVILMATTSIVGVATRALSDGFAPGVLGSWLAAAPVVALGAPLGALVVNRVGRTPTLLVVSALCLMQFVWTFYDGWSYLGITGLIVSCIGLALCLRLFHQLHLWGGKLRQNSTAPAPAPTWTCPFRACCRHTFRPACSHGFSFSPSNHHPIRQEDAGP